MEKISFGTHLSKQEILFQKVFAFNENSNGVNKSKQANQAKPTKSEQIQELIKEILFNSTSQALLKIYQTPSKIVKIFWCVCLLCACSLCAYFVFVSLITFVTYEVSTKTRSYTEQTSLFPKVTFCNKNMFTTKYAYELTNASYMSYDELVYTANFKLNDTERDKLTKKFGDILLECSFNYEKCNATHDFVKEYDKVLGHCYTFNSGVNPVTGENVKIKESIRAGSSYGLKLIVYVNFYEKLVKYNNYLGAIVKIGNSSYKNTNNGVDVAPGFKTNIVIERVFEKHLPHPYSNCDLDNEASPDTAASSSDLYKLIWHSPVQYTQQICFDACAEREIIRQCNCSYKDRYGLFKNATLPDMVWTSKLCEPHNTCIQNVSQSFKAIDCLDSCPLECNQTLYKTSITSSVQLGDSYVDIIKKKASLAEDFLNVSAIDATRARNSIVRIYVLYESLGYVESMEMAMQGSVLTLAANIGGILSLFLGVSVLSLFEVFEVLIEIYFIYKSK